MDAIKEYGIPPRVRTDVRVREYMELVRPSDRNSYTIWSSVHNCLIEREIIIHKINVLNVFAGVYGI